MKDKEISCFKPFAKNLIPFTIDKPAFLEQTLCKYANVVVDYIIGGGVTLRTV